MSWHRTIALALRTLRRHRLRSFFMMLGVTIGIASLTAMSSVGEATRQETLRRFKRMVGTSDVVNIQPGGAATRGMPSLTTVEPVLSFADAAAIAAEARTVTQVAEVQSAFDVDVKYRDRTITTSIWGVSANWMGIRGDEVTLGSAISDDDVRSLARVVIIGEDIRTALFPGEDPIGRQVRIGDVPFQVQGVLASRGAGPGGGSLDNLLLMPVTTASKRLFNRDYLTTITAQLRDPTQPEAAIDELTALLRERHGITPPNDDDFVVTNPRVTMEQVAEVDSTLSRVLTGVSVMATLIGGVVIMSLMLISVSERRREIGVRRALGATRRDVMWQFLAEAAVIAGLGGICGVLIGVASTLIAVVQQQLPPAFQWGAIAGSVLLSVGIGLLFGLQPAWKASRIDPVLALRS